MAVQKGPDIDFSKSTNAFPMDKEPVAIFGDESVDFSKSTGAYPMYDDRNAPQVEARHLTAKVEPQFATPGPISAGHEELVVVQRRDLGLSDDPSGESDAGYEARPSTISVPGADGVERGQVYERGYLVDVATDDESGPTVNSDEVEDAVKESDEKAVDAAEVEAKVVEPTNPKQPRGRARATTK